MCDVDGDFLVLIWILMEWDYANELHVISIVPYFHWLQLHSLSFHLPPIFAASRNFDLLWVVKSMNNQGPEPTSSNICKISVWRYKRPHSPSSTRMIKQLTVLGYVMCVDSISCCLTESERMQNTLSRLITKRWGYRWCCLVVNKDYNFKGQRRELLIVFWNEWLVYKLFLF